MFTITSLACKPVDKSQFVDFGLESPLPNRYNGYTMTITGWVVAPRRTQVMFIDFAGEAIFYRKTQPLTIVRDDVNPRLRRGEKSGFALTLDTLTLPETFTIHVFAALDTGHREHIGTLTGKREPLIIPYQPVKRPMLVLGLGRSGTTLLMKALSAHPQVTANRIHPYETRIIPYWLHTFGVLTAPADLANSSHPDEFLGNPNVIGHSPYYHAPYGAPVMQWWQETYPPEVGAFCLRSIDSFYSREDAVYCAEKWGGVTPTLGYLWSLYQQPACLFVVRDLRDRHASTLSFNARRGGTVFQQVADGADFANGASGTLRSLANIWRRHADTVHMLRYEDLIHNPNETLTRAFEALSLDTTPALIEKVSMMAAEETEQLRNHRTAASVAASVGRWRQDLPREIQQIYTQQAGDLLAEFGYEL